MYLLVKVIFKEYVSTTRSIIEILFGKETYEVHNFTFPVALAAWLPGPRCPVEG